MHKVVVSEKADPNIIKVERTSRNEFHHELQKVSRASVHKSKKQYTRKQKHKEKY